MKPGHGEVLIAEGDVERAEDEQRLIEEFRRQLDAGLWAAVPVAGTAGPARVDHGPLVRRHPLGRRPRDLLPAGGGRPVGRRHRAAGARSDRARRAGAALRPDRPPGRRAAGLASRTHRQRTPTWSYDPGRERRAEQRARALLRSCVNEEEWAMYRDLGFLRVWGTLADGPDDAGGTGGAPVRLPDLPPPADRRLPGPDPPPAQRVLRHVPRRDAPVRLEPRCPTPTTCWPSGWR